MSHVPTSASIALVPLDILPDIYWVPEKHTKKRQHKAGEFVGFRRKNFYLDLTGARTKSKIKYKRSIKTRSSKNTVKQPRFQSVPVNKHECHTTLRGKTIPVSYLQSLHDWEIPDRNLFCV